MASDYLRRIEALETVIAPGRLLVVTCREGEDNDAAIERACAREGMRRGDGHLIVVIYEHDAHVL